MRPHQIINQNVAVKKQALQRLKPGHDYQSNVVLTRKEKKTYCQKRQKQAYAKKRRVMKPIEHFLEHFN